MGEKETAGDRSFIPLRSSTADVWREDQRAKRLLESAEHRTRDEGKDQAHNPHDNDSSQKSVSAAERLGQFGPRGGRKGWWRCGD